MLDQMWRSSVVVSVLLVSRAFAAPPTQKQLTACDKGNGKTCVDIGDAYYDDDEAKARTFYEKACKLKVWHGCDEAGKLLSKSSDPADVTRGRALRESACTANDGPACNDLGLTWSNGTEGAGAKDDTKARTYYDKACKLKDGLGCFNLGLVYERGEGVPVDLPRAHKELEKACGMDTGEACSELGVLYFKGTGVPADNGKSRKYLTKACKLGIKNGCDNLKVLDGP